MIKRAIKEQIGSELYGGKVIVIYGARRVGKTTLSEQILSEQEKLGKKVKYFNCESLNVKPYIETTNERAVKEFLGNNDLVVLDEAQNIENIGLVLKLLVDTYPQMQVIATGSSSFDLVNSIDEPLVGRSSEFILYPFSVYELRQNFGIQELVSKFESILRFGLYPPVYGLDENRTIKGLEQLTSNYLYKDILSFENIKKSKVLVNLLRLLAFQIGNEVSFNELSQKLKVSTNTVIKYVDLLEKCFIVFTLGTFSRNLRNEIGKSQKIYFYDLGIRNALIQSFNHLDMRNDVGALWENFCIIERLKYNQANERFINTYFWRMYSGQEIDYIEEHSGQLDGYEFKYNSQAKFREPKKFLEVYENSSIKVVNSKNWIEFLT